MRSNQTITKVLFHGRLADVFGNDLEMEVRQGCSIAELRTQIASENPQAIDALRSGRVRACVGDSIVPDSHVVAPGEQVEFLPPVSGG